MKSGVKVLLIIIGSLLSMVVVIGLSIGWRWVSTELDLKYREQYTTQYADVERDAFEHSKSYVQGMITDLSNYKREYEKASDEAEKEQVLNFIDSHFATFDASLIENQILYTFLMDVRNGNLK